MTLPTQLSRLMADPDEALKALPKEERQAYVAAQRSVVEARRAANRNEGTRVIG